MSTANPQNESCRRFLHPMGNIIFSLVRSDLKCKTVNSSQTNQNRVWKSSEMYEGMRLVADVAGLDVADEDRVSGSLKSGVEILTGSDSGE